jgi:hypothetical protein
MFKVKIKSNLKVEVLNRLRNTVDAKFVNDMQNEVVDGEIVRLIKAGVSPVRSVEGGRRFKGYKNPESYPNKKKAKRPVNLELTGAMLLWYLVRKISGVRMSFGIPSDAWDDVKERAEANNVGTVNSKGEVAIAARRFIPLAGETYNVSVLRKMKSLYARRIKELLSKR